MCTVYISIGSNLGDREGNCIRAIELLEKKGISVTKKSSVCETTPWGVKDQPLFLNMTIEITTGLKPHELLKILKDIEIDIGRETSSRWGPRLIDLDILLFGDRIVEEDTLRIPHPLMHRRAFVLKPLSEIAPDATHPVLRQRIHELLRQLARKGNNHYEVS
jgi:2-amino-4-hydroxy-6-hydroxymethyldihydropteridine diphosphokinase